MVELTDFRKQAIELALRNLLSGIAKTHDAPMSSRAHLDTAIAALASTTDWRPQNAELAEILADAIEFVSLTRGSGSAKLTSESGEPTGRMWHPDSESAPRIRPHHAR